MSANTSSPLALTNSFQNILSVDISGFPDGSLLECSGMVAATGSDSLVGLIVNINGDLPASQVATWGRIASITGQTVIKTSGMTSISLQARKDNSTVLSVNMARLLVKRIG